MYSFDSRVRYSEVGADGKMSLCSVIHYMQDCSIFQSEDLGVGIAVLKQEKKAWLLSSWQIEIGRRPRLGERLTVGTWASGFKAMYGYRNFILRDESGDDAVRAASIWIYMNLETGRPEKVDDFVAEIYRPEPALEMEKCGPEDRRSGRTPGISGVSGSEISDRYQWPCEQRPVSSDGGSMASGG